MVVVVNNIQKLSRMRVYNKMYKITLFVYTFFKNHVVSV